MGARNAQKLKLYVVHTLVSHARFHTMTVVPLWANPRDADDVDERMVKIKADLLSELVAVCILLEVSLLMIALLIIYHQVCIMRSEFDDADSVRLML